MLVFKELTEKNVLLYAAKHYYNPQFSDIDEFYEDLKRFKYIKRLINKYFESEELSERLILNHLIVLFNVFGPQATLDILGLKFDKKKYWEVLKPFLLFLKYIKQDQYTGISMDKKVVNKLREI